MNNMNSLISLSIMRSNLINNEITMLENIVKDEISSESFSSYFTSNTRGGVNTLGDKLNKRLIDIAKMNSKANMGTINAIVGQLERINKSFPRFSELIETVVTRYDTRKYSIDKKFNLKKYEFPDLDVLHSYMDQSKEFLEDITIISGDLKDLLDLKIGKGDISESFTIINKYMENYDNIKFQSKGLNRIDKMLVSTDPKKEVNDFKRNNIVINNVTINDLLNYLIKLRDEISLDFIKFEVTVKEIAKNIKSLDKRFYELMKSQFKGIYEYYSQADEDDIIISQKLSLVFDSAGYTITKLIRLFLERFQIIISMLGISHDKAQKILAEPFMDDLKFK